MGRCVQTFGLYCTSNRPIQLLLKNLYFIRNHWFQPVCNSTPLTREGPGNYNTFSWDCLTLRKPNKQVLPSTDMIETPSHLDGDGIFWKEKVRLGNGFSIQ
ncbi:hypothetical protein GOODEAATRI_030737 [Goodea atripinnis]|uniref:Uncharacterized protein n=1 Tax=Goodea atripinnis TaxID=208336 RepID=A0ABV0Q2F2_9TELE